MGRNVLRGGGQSKVVIPKIKFSMEDIEKQIKERGVEWKGDRERDEVQPLTDRQLELYSYIQKHLGVGARDLVIDIGPAYRHILDSLQYKNYVYKVKKRNIYLWYIKEDDNKDSKDK